MNKTPSRTLTPRRRVRCASCATLRQALGDAREDNGRLRAELVAKEQERREAVETAFAANDRALGLYGQHAVSAAGIRQVARSSEAEQQLAAASHADMFAELPVGDPRGTVAPDDDLYDLSADQAH